MTRETFRNVLIVLAIAGLLALPQMAGAAFLIGYALRIGLFAAFAYFGYTMWRANRQRLRWMPDRQRAMLYAAAALLVVLLAGSFLFVTSFGVSVLFLLMIVGLGYLVWRLWQDGQRYY